MTDSDIPGNIDCAMAILHYPDLELDETLVRELIQLCEERDDMSVVITHLSKFLGSKYFIHWLFQKIF